MHETLQMMNMNEGDVNLGLGMAGSTNYSIRPRFINSSGAGVNANSRMDLAFEASDPLSELVWSPHNGLSLKCANSSSADKKPFLLWNVGPSNKGPLPSQVIRSEGSRDENAVDHGNATISGIMLDADDIFVDRATLLSPLKSCRALDLGLRLSHGESNGKMEEEGENQDTNMEGGNRNDDGEEDFYHPLNVHSADVQPQKVPDDEVTSAAGAVNKNEVNMPIPILAAPLKKLGSAVENNLCNLTEKDARSLGGKTLPRGNSPPVEGSKTNSRICLYKENGKENVFSDGNICERSLDDEDDTHESVESCNSAGLLSRGRKRQSCSKDVIQGSKRMKIPGSPGLKSIPRPDSSFMNWISNMVKGFSDSNREDSSSFPLPLACSIDVNGKNLHENFMCNRYPDSTSLNMGFQTIFQSLYCRDMNILDTGIQKENDSIKESVELMVDDNKSLENLLGDAKHGSFSKQIIICDREKNSISVGQLSKPCILPTDINCSPHPRERNLAENKALEILVSNRANDGVIPSESLGEQMNNAAENIPPEIPVATIDVPGKSNLHSSLWVTRLCTKNSRSEKCKEIIQDTIECSTIFPKIDLDSWKNAVFPVDQKSSETKDDSSDTQVCASIKESQKSTTNTGVSVDLKFKSKLCSILPSQKLGSSEAMTSVFARRLDALRHIMASDNNVKDNEKSPLCNVVSAQNTVALSKIFHAIRNLRLSRADILRWMNSNISLSHLNGFFLRLRLRKLEGLEGTSYFVACISGDVREHNDWTSNKSILIDVGGFKSSVTCQYVSNHDFLEDEIKAWWCRAMDRGCRVPSLDELNSKFNERISLGL